MLASQGLLLCVSVGHQCDGSVAGASALVEDHVATATNSNFAVEGKTPPRIRLTVGRFSLQSEVKSQKIRQSKDPLMTGTNPAADYFTRCFQHYSSHTYCSTPLSA